MAKSNTLWSQSEKPFAWLHLSIFSIIFLLGALHLLAVLKSVISQGELFQYNFRYYSIFLVGFLLLGTSALALRQFRMLSKGCTEAKRRALHLSLFLLAINLPLIPNEFHIFPYVSYEAANGMIAFGTIVSILVATNSCGLLFSRFLKAV